MITTLEQPIETSTIIEQPILDWNGKATGYKQIYDTATRNYLSTVNSKYKPVEHKLVKDLAHITMNKLGLDFELRENYPRSGRDVFFRFIIKGIDEKVNPLITVKNSYQSGNSLKLITGTYTRICKNGAVLGVKSQGNDFKHIKSTEFGKEKSGLFMNEIQNFVQSFAGHLQYLEEIKAIEMTSAMIEDFFTSYNEKESKAIFNMFMAKNTENRLDNSVHSFYQACTEFYSHEMKAKNSDAKQIIRLTSVQYNIDRILKLVA